MDDKERKGGWNGEERRDGYDPSVISLISQLLGKMDDFDEIMHSLRKDMCTDIESAVEKEVEKLKLVLENNILKQDNINKDLEKRVDTLEGAQMTIEMRVNDLENKPGAKAVTAWKWLRDTFIVLLAGAIGFIIELVFHKK